MCGLTGVLALGDGAVSSAVVARMTDALAHRGPDGQGLWTGAGVALGHRRLAIVDLSPAGAQPMQTANGRYTLIYNGMLYNYRELKVTLAAAGRHFHSNCDTEVLLEALAHWGEGAIPRLNGMFALALWDAHDRTLLLARDRYGVKPLYYVQVGESLLFASEIKAFLEHPEFRVRVDGPALQEYFTFQNVFSDRTLFAGVHHLPPGTTLTVRPGHPLPTPRRYWDFHYQEDLSLDVETCTREVSRLFTQAVDRQLAADVPVGTYLSGGLDSGSVTGVAARQIPNLRTFTCGFDLHSASGMELNFDERARAEYLSYLFKTEHYQVVLKAGDMERVMPDLLWHLEDPRVGQCYPNYYVARLASRFVKVVLSGTGSDELFGGYPWRYYASVFQNDGPEDYAARHYAYWQRLVPDDRQPTLFAEAVRKTLDPGHPYRAFRAVYGDALVPGMSPSDYVNLSLAFESRTFLRGLLTVEDKLSMAHGLETRVPFLDNDLVDFAQRIPVRLKLKSLVPKERIDENALGRKDEQYYARTSDGKLILRHVLSRIMPDEYTRAEKQGFSAPDGSWFKGESLDYIRRLLSRRDARLYEYLDPETVHGLLDEHFLGQKNRRLFIWSCLCLEWWLKRFAPTC